MIFTRDFLIMALSFLPVLPAAAMCFYPVADQLKYPLKRVVAVGTLLLLLLTVPASIISLRLDMDSNFALFPMLVIFFVYYHKCLTVHISRSLAVFMWVVAMMSILSNFVSIFESRIHPDGGALFMSLEGVLLQLGFSSAAAVGLFPLNKYSRALINSFTMNKAWYITVPVTFIFFIMSVMIRPEKYETLYVNNVFIAFWASTILMFMALILLTVIFYFIVMGMIEMMKTDERNRILEMQESRYIKQQRYIEDTAKIRHDFKHTLRMLSELAGAGEYEELKNYLSEYLIEMPQNDTIYYCKDNSINAVLNYYTEQALNADIDLTLRIELPEKLPFSDIDMCGLIGNILDNAITACREVPPDDRRLQFTMMTQNDAQLIIVSVNSFSGKVKKQGERYLSTNRQSSGIGLTSIAATAQRCGGEARFSHDAEAKEFYIDIMMPLKTAVKGE